MPGIRQAKSPLVAKEIDDEDASVCFLFRFGLVRFIRKRQRKLGVRPALRLLFLFALTDVVDDEDGKHGFLLGFKLVQTLGRANIITCGVLTTRRVLSLIHIHETFLIPTS